MFGGRDVLDTMLDVKGGDELTGGIVTFTNQLSELSGSLQDQSGKPVPDFTIVVFSSDRRFWTPQSRRIQAMRPSTDGRFSFRNLPAGEYRLIAVVDPEPGEWFDPAFLNQLVGATMPITIGDGEREVQNVENRAVTGTAALKQFDLHTPGLYSRPQTPYIRGPCPPALLSFCPPLLRRLRHRLPLRKCGVSVLPLRRLLVRQRDPAIVASS